MSLPWCWPAAQCMQGVTWTKQNATSGRDWSVLASSSDGMRLAAGESFGGNIYTSSDGVRGLTYGWAC